VRTPRRSMLVVASVHARSQHDIALLKQGEGSTRGVWQASLRLTLLIHPFQFRHVAVSANLASPFVFRESPRPLPSAFLPQADPAAFRPSPSVEAVYARQTRRNAVKGDVREYVGATRTLSTTTAWLTSMFVVGGGAFGRRPAFDRPPRPRFFAPITNERKMAPKLVDI